MLKHLSSILSGDHSLTIRVKSRRMLSSEKNPVSSSHLYSLKSNSGRFFNAFDGHLMSNQCTNIVDSVSVMSSVYPFTKIERGPYLIIVGRSRLRPHPCTRTSLGSPNGSNISGLNIPLFPISTHFFRAGWNANISREGSRRK